MRALDAAVRHLPPAPADPGDAVRHLAAAAGLATAVVSRPLADVLVDADPSRLWLAVRRGAQARAEALAIPRGSRRGARVAVLGEALTVVGGVDERYPTAERADSD